LERVGINKHRIYEDPPVIYASHSNHLEVVEFSLNNWTPIDFADLREKSLNSIVHTWVDMQALPGSLS